MANIQIKRIYDNPSDDDGYRVLVDRLWPRGISKDKAKIDEWLKDVGPSTELREWFGHDPTKYGEFKKRYEKELATNPTFVELKAVMQNNSTVTFVYSAKDTEHNQAVVLKNFLENS